MGTKFTPEFIELQRAEMDCPFSSYRLQAAMDHYRSALDEIERLQKRMERLVAIKKLLREKLQETKSNWFYWIDSDFVWGERCKTLVKDMNELAKKGNIADIQNYLDQHWHEVVDETLDLDL